MTNPFDEIIERLSGIESKLIEVHNLAPIQNPEIINRDELCKRLDITEPTVIRWEKKGAIPCFRVGSSVRYNWIDVVEALKK